MIRIGKNSEFTRFINEIVNAEDDERVGVDVDDYHWFMISLLECIEGNHLLEIMDDNDGSYEEYYIIDAVIDEQVLNKLSLTLKRRKDKEVVNIDYLMNKIIDNSGEKFRKYYIDTESGRFRFTIFLNS